MLLCFKNGRGSQKLVNAVDRRFSLERITLSR